MKTKASKPAEEKTPDGEDGQVRRPPPRQPYQDRRKREYLTQPEVELLIKTARRRGGRYGHRDATMIFICYRHALRVTELCTLQWDQVDFDQALLRVHRLKNGTENPHPLRGQELRDLRRLKREQTPPSPYLFTTERRGPMAPATFRKLVTTVAQAAGLEELNIHPHMLRHSSSTHLLEEGHSERVVQLYNGHRDIRNTVRYTHWTSKQFQGLWRGD